MRRSLERLVLAAALMGACAGANCKKQPDGPAPSAEPPAPGPHPRPRSSGLSVHSEIGALDPEAAQKAGLAAQPAIDACMAKARKKMPYFGGDADTVLRIDATGAVKWAHFRHSELGDADVERCILDALRAQKWPKPEDADAGEARQSWELRPSRDERPPTAWTDADLGAAGPKLVSALESCRQKSGTPALEVAFYLDTKGAVMSAGVASEDEKGIEAIECAVRAVKAQSYPTPGSYPARVMLRIGS